jgi:hypothetical protein
MSGLHSSINLTRVGNLRPQGYNIHIVLGQELWEQDMRKNK